MPGEPKPGIPLTIESLLKVATRKIANVKGLNLETEAKNFQTREERLTKLPVEIAAAKKDVADFGGKEPKAEEEFEKIIKKRFLDEINLLNA